MTTSKRKPAATKPSAKPATKPATKLNTETKRTERLEQAPEEPASAVSEGDSSISESLKRDRALAAKSAK